MVLGMKPRTGGPPYVCSRELRREADDACEAGDAYPGFPTRNFVEISGYSFVGWGVIAVDDPAVIRHEYLHVENWLGPYGPGKLAFNLVPLMIAGIFLTPFLGLGAVSLALSLALVLAFSLMAFVKIFH